MALKDIRVLVAIDFGTTYSGFAYVHKANPEDVETNHTWPGHEGNFKTATALLYNKDYTEVNSWGDLALEENPDYDDDDLDTSPHPVELFKLHISDLIIQKPWLPDQLNFKEVIRDYLTQMQILIKETLERRWPEIEFPQQVGFVLTIPAEWPHNTTGVMRKCAYEAGLLARKDSPNLEFTTEPEAAALYCLSVVNQHNLRPGDTFLVADCGGGTVDITSRRLFGDNKLGEITERVGYICGSTFVDKQFLHWLGSKVGPEALEKLKSNNYGQMQSLIHHFFCQMVKFKFNGDPKKFRPIRLVLQKYCSDLPQYVVGDYRDQMEEAAWVIRIDFDTVKKIFDPVIDDVIKLIDDQLNELNEHCSAIFLVGGFSESPYLLKRVKEDFLDSDKKLVGKRVEEAFLDSDKQLVGKRHKVPIIAVPTLPIAAVVRGAITYGLNVDIIRERVLKWTYGIEICRKWVAGKDEESRKTSDGYIFNFFRLAKRRTIAEVNRKFSGTFYPVKPTQSVASFKVFYTANQDGTFCDEPGMKFLGTLRIKMPDTHLGRKRPIEFSLTFAKIEIKATAKNKDNGFFYDETTFDLDELRVNCV